MDNLVGLNLNVNQDFIANAVKQSVMMGIAESLNGKNEIVSQIVSMTLNTKVDKYGKISSYSSDNKYTLLEYYVQKMITGVVEEEMNSLVKERREDVAKAIRAELAKKANLNKFVDRFISTVANAVNSTYCPKISVEFKDSEN